CGYDLRGATPGTALNGPRCPECGNAERFVAEGDHAVVLAKASPLNPLRWLSTTHGATLFAVLASAGLAVATSINPNGFAGAGVLLWSIAIGSLQIAIGLALVLSASINTRRRTLRLTLGAALVAISSPGTMWIITIVVTNRSIAT